MKIGDRIFVVDRLTRNVVTYWATVTKVGRRWAEFQRDGSRTILRLDRFDIEKMSLEGGLSYRGRVYASEEEYLAETRLNALWTEFRRQVDRLYQRPPHLTEIGVLKAADALSIKLEGE